MHEPTEDPRTREPAVRYSADLVFVGGIGSGGTDLLMNVLNGHPEIFIPGEFPFLAGLSDRFGPTVPAAEVNELIEALEKADAYRTFMHHYWDNFVANRHEPVSRPPLPAAADGDYTVATVYQWLLGVPEHIRWTGNKTPANTQNIARLRGLFPRARFILIVRDVRDVVVSWKRRWRRDPLLTAEKYRRRMLSGYEQAQAVENGAALIVRYEDLLDDFELQCSHICDFLGLELSPQMLSFHEHVNRSFASKPNYHRPLLPGNYGKWQQELESRSVRRVEEIAFPAMTAYGYTPSIATSPRPITRWECQRGRVRDVYGALTVNNRFEGQNPVLRTVKNLAFLTRKATTERSVVD